VFSFQYQAKVLAGKNIPNIVCFLARSAKLPTKLYILPSVIFFLFFFFFLSSFLMISRRQIISGSAGLFFDNESVLGADDRSGPLFPIPQGTLPWQPIL